MIVQLSKTASEPLKKDVAKTLETTIFSSYRAVVLEVLLTPETLGETIE